MGFRRWLGLMTIEFPELGCTTGGCRCFPLGSVVDELDIGSRSGKGHFVTHRCPPLFTLHQLDGCSPNLVAIYVVTQVDFRYSGRCYYYLR